MPRTIAEWTIVVVVTIFGVDRLIVLVRMIVHDTIEVKEWWKAKGDK